MVFFFAKATVRSASSKDFGGSCQELPWFFVLRGWHLCFWLSVMWFEDELLYGSTLLNTVSQNDLTSCKTR